MNCTIYSVIAVSLLLLAVVGCGRETGGRYAVSGYVTFNGQPLDHGTISFLSIAEANAMFGGALISGGKYELPVVHGLQPGAYRVEISSPAEATATEADYASGNMSLTSTERIPPAYNTASTLKIEVTAGGKNQFNFNLQ